MQKAPKTINMKSNKNFLLTLFVLAMLATTVSAKQVNNTAIPPRKQLLNDRWQFVLNDSDFTQARTVTLPHDWSIEQPFSATAAAGNEGGYLPTGKGWYRRTLTLGKAYRGKKLRLYCEGVYMNSRVYVNGHAAGGWPYGYSSFWVDITPYAHEGNNEIVVSVDNSAQKNCRWYSGSGIYRPVWLVTTPMTYIDDWSIEVTTSDIHHVELSAQVVSPDGSRRPLKRTLEITNPRLWSPDDPYLYDLSITAKKDGTVTDQVDSYCGMRKIEVHKDANNLPRIYLNNEQIFQMGPLDQGWWPDGLYMPASDEAFYFDIKAMKNLGCNMMRKHIKIEPARWYYWADRLGMLVWQDLPSPNLPQGHEDFAKANFEAEVTRIIPAIKNAPSIVHWVVFNEGWGQFDTNRMTSLVDTKVNALTPARFGKASLICCASGWTDSEIGDIIDLHSYPNPSCPQNANRAAVCGEYGGITLKVPGHIWPGGDFQYTVVETSQDFTTFYNGLCDKIKDMYYQGLNAAVYTQLSDVEIEKNGFYTYDRRAKAAPKRLAAVFDVRPKWSAW